jgi:hypothetical protein
MLTAIVNGYLAAAAARLPLAWDDGEGEDDEFGARIVEHGTRGTDKEVLGKLRPFMHFQVVNAPRPCDCITSSVSETAARRRAC